MKMNQSLSMLVSGILLASLVNYVVVCHRFESVKIVVVNGYERLERFQELQQAIQWFHQVINVSINEQQTIKYDDVFEASNDYRQFNWLHIQTIDQSSYYHVNDVKFRSAIESANFLIYVERDEEACRKDSLLLAYAQPFSLDNTRPKIGKMQVCPSSQNYQNYFDLFRHEILHALGYGTYWPSKKEKISPKSETYHWNSPYNRIIVNRTYIDFYKNALKEARNHFKCASIQGIQADNHNKMHLNEYIFGNELMTPHLQDGRNYFSSISAAILEDTFLGDLQWYKVNREYLKYEFNAYSYGRGFGCNFLTKSCYDFIKGHPESTYPLCSSKATNQCFLHPAIKQKIRFSSLNAPTCKLLDHDQGGMINRESPMPLHRICPYDENYFYYGTSIKAVDC